MLTHSTKKNRLRIMNEFRLNKEEFKLFNQDDQFGFFYDEEGWPKKNADANFDKDVESLYGKYDYISIDFQDNIYGIKNGEKELIMKAATEAYYIAREVKEE